VADSDYAEAHPPAVSAPSIRGRHGKVSRTNIAALVRRVDFTVMVAVLEQIRFGSPAFD
jgi:hypothetical protein